MNSVSEKKLSMDELKQRNAVPTISSPLPSEQSLPMQHMMTCPISPEQVDMLIEAADSILTELRVMNKALASLPTKDDALEAQKTLEQMLTAMQPPVKPVGKKNAKRSSRIGSKIRERLRCIQYCLPTPSREWLIVVPFGAAAYLAWYCVNHLAHGIAQILP